VCTPEDAIRSFLAGSVDVLALDSFIVEKSVPSQWQDNEREKDLQTLQDALFTAQSEPG